MKYLILLLVVLLLVAIAAPAKAQVPARSPNSAVRILIADPPPVVPPPTAQGFLDLLVAFLTPRVDERLVIEKDQDTWSRLARLRIPDKDAKSEYMRTGILTTAALSAGAVGLGLWDASSGAQRFSVKACRSGAMIGIRGEF